jgi:hypothetical protein
MNLRCGDRIWRKENHAHTGRLNAIFTGSEVNVKWDNGWYESLAMNEIERLH